MKKREFIKTLGLGSLALAGTGHFSELLANSGGQRTGSRKNWIWMTPKKGMPADYWKRQMELVKSSGIDAILPEVYNGHHAFYDTDRFPVVENWLEVLIPICKSLDLEIHTWMWTMPCSNPAFVKKHPDWYVVNRNGESAAVKPPYVPYYKFMDACHPEVQEFVRENVESLAKIPEIDGVHLDYVRLPDVILAEGLQPKYNIVQDSEFPEYDYSYSDYCRKQFKAITGIDPLTDLDDPQSNEAWRQFRYDSITNLVNGKLIPEAKKYKKQITAAVFPNWWHVRQEWRAWKLDGVLPMLYHGFYNEDLNWVKMQCKKGVGDMIVPKPLYSGLFMSDLNPDELKEAYKLSMEGGASGISLFSLGGMKEGHWKALKSLVHK